MRAAAIRQRKSAKSLTEVNRYWINISTRTKFAAVMLQIFTIRKIGLTSKVPSPTKFVAFEEQF
jgi:hypothetical protein